VNCDYWKQRGHEYEAWFAEVARRINALIDGEEESKRIGIQARLGGQLKKFLTASSCRKEEEGQKIF